MTAWHTAAALAELDPETPRALSIDGLAVGLYLVDGEPLAIGNLCPHQENVRLSDGWVEDGTIECPMHQSRFDLRTGACLGPPAWQDVPSYPVRISDGMVLIGIDRAPV